MNVPIYWYMEFGDDIIPSKDDESVVNWGPSKIMFVNNIRRMIMTWRTLYTLSKDS